MLSQFVSDHCRLAGMLICLQLTIKANLLRGKGKHLHVPDVQCSAVVLLNILIDLGAFIAYMNITATASSE